MKFQFHRFHSRWCLPARYKAQCVSATRSCSFTLSPKWERHPLSSCSVSFPTCIFSHDDMSNWKHWQECSYSIVAFGALQRPRADMGRMRFSSKPRRLMNVDDAVISVCVFWHPACLNCIYWCQAESRCLLDAVREASAGVPFVGFPVI